MMKYDAKSMQSYFMIKKVKWIFCNILQLFQIYGVQKGR